MTDAPVPRATLTKPSIGAPCNGCGVCCTAQICSAGSFALGLAKHYGERVVGPCPAIHLHDDGTMTCRIVERPREYLTGNVHDTRRAFTLLIGSGAGCDDAGSEHGDEADARLMALGRSYLDRVGTTALKAAAQTAFKGKL